MLVAVITRTEVYNAGGSVLADKVPGDVVDEDGAFQRWKTALVALAQQFGHSPTVHGKSQGNQVFACELVQTYLCLVLQTFLAGTGQFWELQWPQIETSPSARLRTTDAITVLQQTISCLRPLDAVNLLAQSGSWLVEGLYARFYPGVHDHILEEEPISELQLPNSNVNCPRYRSCSAPHYLCVPSIVCAELRFFFRLFSNPERDNFGSKVVCSSTTFLAT